MSLNLQSAVPSGPIDQKWTKHKMESRLINPVSYTHLTLPTILLV